MATKQVSGAADCMQMCYKMKYIQKTCYGATYDTSSGICYLHMSTYLRDRSLITTWRGRQIGRDSTLKNPDPLLQYPIKVAPYANTAPHS